MTLDAAAFHQRIPARTSAALKELVASLAKTLGNKLTAVMVHGSAVRGGWREDLSDIDVLVVLTDDSPEALATISPALHLAYSAQRIEAILLRTDEIARSADVFPLMYADIQRCHALLHGTNPFAGLTFQDAHVRLRTEQELRDARIRLRRIVVDDEGLPARMATAIERKLKQIRSPLHALLRLSGRDGSDDLARVLEDCGAVLKLELAPLRAVRERPAEALVALRALLDAAINAADEMETRLK